jgi:hypothetical protein
MELKRVVSTQERLDVATEGYTLAKKLESSYGVSRAASVTQVTYAALLASLFK